MKPIIIEFLGTPGAGKTTMLASAAKFFAERDFHAYTVVQAARPFAQRTLAGKIVNFLAPPSLRRPLLWQVFTILSLAGRLSFFFKYHGLVKKVITYQYGRPSTAEVVQRGVLKWFFRLVGYYQFLLQHAMPRDVLILDDGFVHRVVHFFSSDVETPVREDIAGYLDLIPRPDLLIILRAPLPVCEERVHSRGIWEHSRHKSRAEIGKYLASAETAVNYALEYAKIKQWAILEVDNSGEPDQAAAELTRKLTENSVLMDNLTPAPSVFRIPRPSRLTEYIQSRLRPLDVEPATVQSVLNCYGLTLTMPPANLPLSRRTRNVTVHTSAGKKVLKRYRAMLQPETIAYSHSILTRLAELNFPVLRVNMVPSGADFVNYDGGNYALFDFVEGTNYSLNYLMHFHRLELMGVAGQTLARFHRSLDGFMPSGQHHLGFTSYSGDWKRNVSWHERKAAELLEKSRDLKDEAGKAQANWLVQNCQYILNELGLLDEKLRNSPLPRLIIHGDFGLHNLVFPKDGYVIMLDFETARLEWRLSDLVSALSRLRYRNGMYNFESIKSFMSGYQSVFPLNRDEQRLFSSVWRFYKLRSALVYWNSYFETSGPVRKMISARDAVGQADWVLQHPEMFSGLAG